jgi:phage portal protein BeeE
MSANVICSAFHVPPFKIGMGPFPPAASLEVMNGIYYADCLQAHIEAWENSMDDGLGLNATETNGRMLGIELDIDQLLRMDQKSMIDMLAVGVGSAIYSPDEARKRVELEKVKGGSTPYLQQQNFSLEALAERDENSPFAKPAAAPSAPAAVSNDDEVKALTERLALLESRDPASDLAAYVERELAYV